MEKKTQNQLRNSHLKAQGIIFFVILMIYVSPVFAMDWDNVKSYDEVTKTVTITNALGLPEWLGGEQITTIRLDTPHSNLVMPGKDRLVAQLTFNVADTSYADSLKSMQTYSLKNMQTINRPITYKYRVTTGQRAYYEKTGEYCKLDEKNGTICTPIYKTLYEDVYDWVKIEGTDLSKVPDKNIVIGLFSDVYENDAVEWIPTWFGKEISEFASWNASFENGLTEYWNMSDNQELVAGAYNLSNNDGTARFTTTNCKIGGCLNTSDHNNARININRDFDASGTGLTWNFWVRIINVAADGPMITQGDGNTAFIQQFAGSYLGKSTWVGSEQAD